MRPINLLPPEAARRTRARRRVSGVVALGVAYLVLLALVTVWWQMKAGDAEDDLAAQLEANESLTAEIAALEGAAQLRQRYETGIGRMQTVLQRDVAWGRLLNDLGRVIPDRTWLTSFSGEADSTGDDPVTFGQVQAGGVAFDYPDASSWLRVLDADEWPAVGGAWVTSVQVGEVAEVPVVNFSSVASLTQAAVSERDQRLPQVPE